MKESLVLVNLTCAVICAKWALDLGLGQVRQILHLIGGIFLGPIMLLILYVNLVNKARNDVKPGGNLL